MKPPKLYRKVYVVANEFNDDDQSVGLLLGKVYVRVNLALDRENEPFWQIHNDENNILDFEFSDLDNYDLDCEWSNKDDPEQLEFIDANKHNHSNSFNRRKISQQFLDEIPF